MNRADEHAMVIDLAVLTESRTDEEQRALLSFARQTDDARNKRRRVEYRAKEGLYSDARALPDPSNLESLVFRTRAFDPDNGDKPVVLKDRRRRPWVDGDK